MLIRVVNLLERPSSGRVEVGGVDITDLAGWSLRAARRGIGMIFQHFNLLSSRTVFGNIALPLELVSVLNSALPALNNSAGETPPDCRIIP